jgi:hypothetical protein
LKHHQLLSHCMSGVILRWLYWSLKRVFHLVLLVYWNVLIQVREIWFCLIWGRIVDIIDWILVQEVWLASLLLSHWNG